jgi:hypothetical protein
MMGSALNAKVVEAVSEAYTQAGHKRKLQEMFDERRDSAELLAYRESLAVQLGIVFEALAAKGMRACTLRLCAEQSMYQDVRVPDMKEIAEDSYIWSVIAMPDVTEVLSLGLAEWALENGIMCNFRARNYTQDDNGGSVVDEQVLEFTWA